MLSFIKSVALLIRQRMDGFRIHYGPHHHEREILAFFRRPGHRLFSDRARPMAAPRQLLLCFTNRCGSNWLAELIHATGLAGKAEESFNSETVREICEREGITALDDYIRFLATTHNTEAGIFATQLSWDQLYFLTRVKAIPRILHAPKFVHLVRQDVAAQALSLLMAKKTGQWSADWNDGTHGTAEPEAITDQELTETAQMIRHDNAWFDLYFRKLGVTPLRLSYERIAQDPEAAVREILAFLEIAPPQGWSLDPARLTLRRQRDDRAKERVARFHSTTRGFYAA